MVLVPTLDHLTGSPPSMITHVDAAVDSGEVLRYLGYPSSTKPGVHVVDEIEKWVEQSSLLAEARCTYRLFAVAEKTRARLDLLAEGRLVSFHGAIGEFLSAADYIAVFIATAGPRIEALASDLLRRGEDLAAMVVNAVGAERAEAAESAAMRELQAICEPVGYAPTLPYSPGYCGMKLTEQRTLFSLFSGVDVGVTLTDSCLMQPVKSISGLIGLGPAEDVISHGSPCDRCELYQCAMRR